MQLLCLRPFCLPLLACAACGSGPQAEAPRRLDGPKAAIVGPTPEPDELLPPERCRLRLDADAMSCHIDDFEPLDSDSCIEWLDCHLLPPNPSSEGERTLQLSLRGLELDSPASGTPTRLLLELCTPGLVPVAAEWHASGAEGALRCFSRALPLDNELREESVGLAPPRPSPPAGPAEGLPDATRGAETRPPAWSEMPARLWHWLRSWWSGDSALQP